MSPQDTPAKPWLRVDVLLCGWLVAAAISLGQAVVPSVTEGRVFNESSGSYLQNACVTIDGSTITVRRRL